MGVWSEGAALAVGIREVFLEEEGLEAGEGAQRLSGQGPHILWNDLGLTLHPKDRNQFFLSSYMFHPELSSGNLERNHMQTFPRSDSPVGETETPLSKELPPTLKLCTSVPSQLESRLQTEPPT